MKKNIQQVNGGYLVELNGNNKADCQKEELRQLFMLWADRNKK